MEKKKIKVNYTDSGVRTLAGFGTLLYVLATIMIVTVIVVWFIAHKGATDVSNFPELATLIAGLIAIFMGALCRILSTIGRTALYRRTLLEKEYDFGYCPDV